MRIIAGRARGARIDAPRGTHTRPTLDRVRESIFSILVSHTGGLNGFVVLDGFAGSGALGLEAWSRGAREVVFVEAHPAACKLIAQNAKAVGAQADVAVCRGRLPQALGGLLQHAPFDLMLFDAPYGAPELVPTLQEVHANGLLAVDAVLMVEHDARTPPEFPEAFEVVTRKRYGTVGVTLLQLAD